MSEINIKKPLALKKDDRIATVCHSWGGAATYPERYQRGKKQLEENFGVKVIEAPHTLENAEVLKETPRLRAEDLMWCFSNNDAKAIFSVIGGDDAIRLLAYMDLDVIRNNPKIFMGYSDATIIHLMCYKAGVSSFYGPSIMAGFDENADLFEYMKDSVQKTLFSTSKIGLIEPNKNGWTDDGSLSWADKSSYETARKLKKSESWQFVQGKGRIKGHLLGGCVEVLEMAKGTKIWPELSQWKGAILFLETSEEAPSVDYFKRCLRNYAAMGVLDVLNGIILGRPMNVASDKINQYDNALIDVIRNEMGLTELPVITQMDFGHTAPTFILPYGAVVEIDCDKRTFSIIESGVS